LAQGDRVISIDDKPIGSWYEFTAEVAGNPGRTLTFEVERAGRRMQVRATPEPVAEGDRRIGRLKVEVAPELKGEFERMTTIVRYNAIAAIPQAAAKVWDLSVFSIKMLGRMIIGDISWKNLSGPITIADYAGQSAQLGWITYLGFLALVSVSLGVLNLLPLPVLDGGHLMYYLFEAVTGRQVSDLWLDRLQRGGVAIMLMMMSLALYNDMARLLGLQ
jgi:regulator of sigma E protease